MGHLTQKQEKFIQNIVNKGMSQREAYRDAYSCERMSDKSVDECASKLLKNKKIIPRLQELQRAKEGVENFGLNLREEKFVEALILGESQRNAYRNAFNCRNLKEKTIDEKASRLFNTGKVQARYKTLLNSIVQSAEKETIMKGEELLQELSTIARSSLGDVLDVRVVEGQVDIGLKQEFSMKNVKDLYLDRNGNVRVKMYDKMEAITRLADLQNVKTQEMEKDNVIVVELGDAERWSE